MLYAILIYADESVFGRLSAEEQHAALEQHRAFQAEYGAQGALGPVAQLMGSASAFSVRQEGESVMVLDGPFAETKECLVGFYVVECASIEDAIAAAKKFPLEIATYEIRPIAWSMAMGNLTPHG